VVGSSAGQLRSARARRDERVVVAVSLDVDGLMLLPVPVEPLPIVDDPVVPVPVPVVEDPVVPPVAVPLERVVPVSVAVLPVVPVWPAVGPEVVVLLLGEPEAPPWPLALVPEPVPELLDCASAPPQASAAAAERARILKVCLM
jgi:hypothetical protein